MGALFSKLHSSSDTQMTEVGNQYALTFQNSRIAYISGKFLYSPEDITNFHKIFRIMDNQGTGYITIENLFGFLEEELNSIVSPYLEYLFQLIEKETEDKITFPEWLPAISLFCLYSREQIFAFVFQMLDNDHDNNISKKDLMNFLVQERFNQKIFPFNYVKAVELMDIERPDKINLDLFRKIQMQIPFICYPAFRLQQSLQKKVLGYKFWQKTYEKIKTKEADENKSKQADRFKEELKKKQQIKIDNKIEKFNNQMREFKIVQEFIKKDRSVRRKKRSNSDSRINAFVESPESLIENVFQQYQKQIRGQQSVKRFKDLKTLRCRSRSLVYIKQEIKMPILKRRKNAEIQILPAQKHILSSKQMGEENKRQSVFSLYKHSIKGIDTIEYLKEASQISQSIDRIKESESESNSESEGMDQSGSHLNSQQKYMNSLS